MGIFILSLGIKKSNPQSSPIPVWSMSPHRTSKLLNSFPFSRIKEVADACGHFWNSIPMLSQFVFTPGVADTQIWSLGAAGREWSNTATGSTLGKCLGSCRKANLNPSKSYLNASIRSGHHICELHACDHRVTSTILSVMVKPKGSTAGEWEIDHFFWTDPTVSQNLCAWPRYYSDKCFGDIYTLDETRVV